mgnify:CR=1 FL=1|tara:strand:- start:4860 stop:5063 length:204 start_codon:yes stop_codon:yes gene_type:complete
MINWELFEWVFLIPWYLLGWVFKWLFSGVVWFTLILGIHYMVKSNWKWELRNPFKRKEDIDDDFYGV